MVSRDHVEIILLNLHQRVKIVNRIVGETAGEAILQAPDAESLADKLSQLSGSFAADPLAFMQNENQIRTLAEIVREYKSFAFDPLHDLSDITDMLSGILTGHEHTWQEILEKPLMFPPVAHLHDWSDITNPGDPLNHEHAWEQITGKPTHFTADVHQHTWQETLYKPLTFPPEAHTQAWDTITGKPATFPPDAHEHDYATSWEDLTDKPQLLSFFSVTYVGDGNSPRMPPNLPTNFLCKQVWLINETDVKISFWAEGQTTMIVMSDPVVLQTITVDVGEFIYAGNNGPGKNYRFFALGYYL